MLAVIGGSGLYALEGVEWDREHAPQTPFGGASARIREGRVGGIPVLFLARHGEHHGRDPAHVNYRANLFALKILGVTRVLSVAAVGSLREEIAPGHLVVPDQLVDRTRHRCDSFFGEGIVAHASMAHPFCGEMRSLVVAAARSTGAIVHDRGTYLCMEGPQFSTLAESRLYRSWGLDVIGMTNATEARLAREAELCFATLALSTDYDCWHPDHGSVTVEAILAVLRENAVRANRTVHALTASLPAMRSCACGAALEHALITPRTAWPADQVERLKPLLARFLEGGNP